MWAEKNQKDLGAGVAKVVLKRKAKVSTKISLGELVMFENFWKIYPRKVSKKKAFDAFTKLKREDQEAAIEALPNHVKYWEMKQTEQEFIPHASTWLNNWRWEDELDFKEKAPPALPWYADEELTMKKAAEVGVIPYAGEGWSELRKRIADKIRQVA